MGARGQGIQIADCEYGYIDGHEDLCNVFDEPGQTVHPDVPISWHSHGTAVLGAMIGLDNDYGINHSMLIFELLHAQSTGTPKLGDTTFMGGLALEF